MFAGKTTRLMDIACQHNHNDVLVVKHASDVRYGSQELLYTHSSRTLPCVVVSTLQDIVDYESYAEKRYIFIDEGQFFDDLAEFCARACESGGKHIHIAALNGDAYRRAFPSISEIAPLVDSVTTLYARCHRCADPSTSVALFSYRKPADNMTCGLGPDVGAADKYEALCRYHYIVATTNNGCT
jgi:thymidine kinase